MFLTLLICKSALQQMDDYLDGELVLSDMLAVSRHLRLCHACQRKFAFEAQLSQEMRDQLQKMTALEERALTDMSARVLCSLSELDEFDLSPQGDHAPLPPQNSGLI